MKPLILALFLAASIILLIAFPRLRVRTPEPVAPPPEPVAKPELLKVEIPARRHRAANGKFAKVPK